MKLKLLVVGAFCSVCALTPALAETTVVTRNNANAQIIEGKLCCDLGGARVDPDEDLFAMLDTDSNGRITRREAEDRMGLQRNFARANAFGGRGLNRDEFHAWIDRGLAQQGNGTLEDMTR